MVARPVIGQAPTIVDVLHRLHRDPAAPDAGAVAERLLEVLERDTPDLDTMRTVARNAYLLMGLGQPERTRALMQQWRRAIGRHGPVAQTVAFADAFLALASAPRAAARELVELLDTSADGAALAVTGLFAVGELDGCIALARRHRLFIGRPGHVYGAAYAAWACALLGDHAAADEILALWRESEVKGDDRAAIRGRVLMLRAAAWVADTRQRHTIAEAHAEDALDLCRAVDLGVERVFLEAELVVYRARRGDLDGARGVARGWHSEVPKVPTVFQAHRDMARMEIALAAESWRAASRHGLRALKVWQLLKHEVLTSQLRFGLALTAAPEEFDAAVRAYATSVMRAPVPHHVARLRVLERCVSEGLSTATELTLVERTRFSRDRVPLMRLWLPRAGLLSADLYADRVQQHLYVRGEGPLSLAEVPVLAALLDALLDADEFSVPVDELFQRVWGGPYRPLVHEGKVRVTLHRLRAWLAARVQNGARLIEMKDGVVSLARASDVRVLERADADTRGPRASVEERVLEALTGGASSADAMARRARVSRSTVLTVLRTLVHKRHVKREGRGPATTYHLKW